MGRLLRGIALIVLSGSRRDYSTTAVLPTTAGLLDDDGSPGDAVNALRPTGGDDPAEGTCGERSGADESRQRTDGERDGKQHDE